MGKEVKYLVFLQKCGHERYVVWQSRVTITLSSDVWHSVPLVGYGATRTREMNWYTFELYYRVLEDLNNLILSSLPYKAMDKFAIKGYGFAIVRK